MKQLSIDFNPDITKVFKTCREYIGARVHQIGRPQKSIAADMDYSPSDLTRKLAQSPNDSRRFTLDDLELYIKTTGDLEPIKYLVAKHMVSESEEILQKRIAELQAQLEVAAGNKKHVL